MKVKQMSHLISKIKVIPPDTSIYQLLSLPYQLVEDEICQKVKFVLTDNGVW